MSNRKCVMAKKGCEDAPMPLLACGKDWRCGDTIVGTREAGPELNDVAAATSPRHGSAARKASTNTVKCDARIVWVDKRAPCSSEQ